MSPCPSLLRLCINELFVYLDSVLRYVLLSHYLMNCVPAPTFIGVYSVNGRADPDLPILPTRLTTHQNSIYRPSWKKSHWCQTRSWFKNLIRNLTRNLTKNKIVPFPPFFRYRGPSSPLQSFPTSMATQFQRIESWRITSGSTRCSSFCFR